MAKLSSGILGGISGSIANVVGGSWKGVPYIRQKPASVANPNTAGQVAQRSKFTNVVEFAKAILVDTIKPCWDRFTTKMSGYNAFVQANIDFFDSDGIANESAILISRGSLALDDLTASDTGGAGNDVDLEFTSTAGTGNALGTDEVYAVVYNETQNNFGQSSAVETRASEAATVVMPTAIATGDVLYSYLAFRKADGTLVSNTSYMQVTNTN